ncbi:TIM44-like domain-containing protein [Xanthobacter sp. KR7-65]|uniref:TIM44-like domain-containing protein n=1 Tax=Xanthobacter sp. KR7-65 TaxID=3156612 RepID=UPI0032B40BFB
MSRFRNGSLLAVMAVVGALCLVGADHAEARKGISIGSRGTRTYQTPAPTQTAPGAAAPVQRSTTPQAQPGPTAAQRPQATPPRSSMFGSGLGGALMRGLLIGGLVGMLMGGGLGGLAGALGLVLQLGLIALVVFVVMRLLRGSQPAPAGAGARYGGGGAGFPPRPAPASARPSAADARPNTAHRDEIGVTPADLDTFERLLATIQGAYSREDQGELRQHTTPEMFGFLADELRDNAEAGLRNEVSDIKLLQGDVAESWREGPLEYATVAMRYAGRDVMVERASGRPVSGDVSGAGETTEVWTFVRQRGATGAGPWRVSAIQTT